MWHGLTDLSHPGSFSSDISDNRRSLVDRAHFAGLWPYQIVRRQMPPMVGPKATLRPQRHRLGFVSRSGISRNCCRIPEPGLMPSRPHGCYETASVSSAKLQNPLEPPPDSYRARGARHRRGQVPTVDDSVSDADRTEDANHLLMTESTDRSRLFSAMSVAMLQSVASAPADRSRGFAAWLGAVASVVRPAALARTAGVVGRTTRPITVCRPLPRPPACRVIRVVLWRRVGSG